MPFVTGYGVELGLLLDIYQDSGLDAIAQVDLGRRVHAHQSTEALGAMSGQIMLTAWSRLERHGRMLPLEAPRRRSPGSTAQRTGTTPARPTSRWGAPADDRGPRVRRRAVLLARPQVTAPSRRLCYPW